MFKLFSKKQKVAGAESVTRYPDGWLLLDFGRDKPVQDRFAITDASHVVTPLLDFTLTRKVQSPNGPPTQAFVGYLQGCLQLHKDGDMSYLLRPEVAQLFSEHSKVVEQIAEDSEKLKALEEKILAEEAGIAA